MYYKLTVNWPFLTVMIAFPVSGSPGDNGVKGDRGFPGASGLIGSPVRILGFFSHHVPMDRDLCSLSLSVLSFSLTNSEAFFF